ncbi:MAG: hypothetical protein ACREHD_26540, partial [Pirellulales bacterium]
MIGIIFMRSFLRFYFECLKRAFPRVWDATWIPSSVAAILFAAVFPILGPFEMATNLLVGVV